MPERQRRPYKKPRLRRLDPQQGRRLIASADKDPATKEDESAQDEVEPRKDGQP